MLNNLPTKHALALGVVIGMAVTSSFGFYILTPLAIKAKAPAPIEQKAADASAPTASLPNQIPKQTNISKTDKPKVELFVMSYCPFGLQMEKAFLPVFDLLKNKADMSIKFVSYAMHGKIEIEENTRQFCVQQEENQKYAQYLGCFSLKNDADGCLSQTKIDKEKISSCIDKTNKNFGIMDKYQDKSTWLNGRFPVYPIHENLNNEYGVQGSPTLVINGVQTQAERTPEGIKNAVCAAFNNAPQECFNKLSNTPATPGFGAGEGIDTGDAGCGNI